MADIDGVLERLITDTAFRAQLNADPGTALAGYDLTAEDIQVLASTMDDGAGDQHGVEQRTSKSAIVGLLASLTGGGGGGVTHKGGSAKPDDLLDANHIKKVGGDNTSQLLAPPQDAMSKDAMKLGAGDASLTAPSGAGAAGAHDYYVPPVDVPSGSAGGGSGEAHAAVDFFQPATEKVGVAPEAVQGNFAPEVNGDAPLAGVVSEKLGHLESDGITGNLSPEVNGDGSPAVFWEWGQKTGTDGISGNLSPDPGGGTANELNGVNGDGTSAGIQPWNGDSSEDPAQLIGLLQPPSGDGTKGVDDLAQMKAGDTIESDFLTIEDG